MHTIKKGFNLEAFFAKLAKATEPILMLDFDGTLAPFCNDPSQVVLYPGVEERLIAISTKTDTLLYIVSGRGLESLEQVLPKTIAWEELWASHGAERLTKDNKYWSIELTALQKEGLEQAKRLHTLPGSFCENKPLSVAIHWRRANNPEGVQKEVLKAWEPLTKTYDLYVHYFSGGIELRPSGMTKRNAVQALVKDEKLACYLGDDKTDEEAFQALGERGLKVLVGRNIPVSTHADIQLIPPDELLAFFDLWLERTKR